MEVRTTAIPGVLLIRPVRHGDARGFFSEVYNRRRFAAHGIDLEVVQDSQSRSAAAGTLRGLHFQKPPFAQAKLVRVLRGRILDVAVDLRPASATRGRHVAVELDPEGFWQLFVPRGCAHGFLTLEPETEVLYKVDAYWDPASEAGIVWNDPDLAIPWPVPPGGPVLSDKDARLPRLRELPADVAGG